MGVFDELYNVIFPFLGNVFGFLSQFARSPIDSVIRWFFGLKPAIMNFNYYNLFTGELLSFFSPLYGNVVGPFIGNSFLVILRLWGIAGTTPTWCALILIAVNFGIITRCLKSLIPSLK